MRTANAAPIATDDGAGEHWEIEWFGRLDSVDMELVERDQTSLCELPELANVGDEDEGHLSDESLALLAALRKWISPAVGAASMRELQESWVNALRWAQSAYDPERGSFVRFARTVVWTKAQQFRRRHTKGALDRERSDEWRRRAAVQGQASLAKYLATSQGLIARAQLAYPRRWHIPGMTDEDVIGELGIQLLEHVRSERPWEPYERVGREATFVFFDRVRRALKKRRQIYELTDSGFLPDDLLHHAPTPEDVASSKSTARYLEGVFHAAAPKMSKTQRSWFNRMRADVRWFGDLNEARVAAQLGRSRSAANRAKDAVRDVIERELDGDWDGV